MSIYDDIDYFTDASLVADPHPYFDQLRAQSPVLREPHHGVMAVTGYDEAVEVYRAHEIFSSIVAPTGPFPPLPFEPVGDISALIAQHRDKFPMHEHMVTFDQPRHTAHRDLLKALFTPRRLKQNEEFMWGLADRQLDEFIASGSCEFLTAYAQPFAVLVIANLLGVPEEDYDEFRRHLARQTPPGAIDDAAMTGNPLEFATEKFTGYLADRRANPRNDVLTALATATFADGSLPDIGELVHLAVFVFAAGQETTAKLMTSGLRILAERPDLQQMLREDTEQIPNFVEECLRMEAPVKSDFRLSRTASTLGGVPVPAGTTVMVLPGAANRDPSRFDRPHEFRVDRDNVREHIAFAKGIHTCPGGPLARLESRISFERILLRMNDIRVSEAHHGPAGAHRFRYEPTYVLRGLSALYVDFTPVR